MRETILDQLRAGQHDCSICGFTHKSPAVVDQSSSSVPGGQGPRELIAAVWAYIDQLASATTHRMAERIKAGESDDERVALLVKTTRALESALASTDDTCAREIAGSDWMAARIAEAEIRALEEAAADLAPLEEDLDFWVRWAEEHPQVNANTTAFWLAQRARDRSLAVDEAPTYPEADRG